MYRIDLHTHSSASPDGGLRASDYREVLSAGVLDFAAVTDHDTIAFAKKLHQEIGAPIIIGEEISTMQGEIIGLYLDEAIPPGLSLEQAVQAIHKQGGLVYVPHPFETVRKGLPQQALDAVADYVDIIEIHNSRAMFQNRSRAARAWSVRQNVPGAASSDTHGRRGWGRAYSLIAEPPTTTTLVELLKDARYGVAMAGTSGLLYPKFNRLRKKLGHA